MGRPVDQQALDIRTQNQQNKQFDRNAQLFSQFADKVQGHQQTGARKDLISQFGANPDMYALMQDEQAAGQLARDPAMLKQLQAMTPQTVSNKKSVQSRYVTDKGTIGLIYRSGEVEDTGQRVSQSFSLTDDGLIFSNHTGKITQPGSDTDLSVEEIIKIENESRERKGTAEAEKAFKVMNKKEAIKAGNGAIVKIRGIDKNVLILDEAIAALDDGANVGYMAKYAPNLKKSSAELQNVGDRLGLDIIGSVTFGALSKGEMDKAMATAMPPNLGEKDLRNWFIERKEAQLKLRGILSEIADKSAQGMAPSQVFAEMEKKRKAAKKQSGGSNQTAADRLKASKAKAGY